MSDFLAVFTTELGASFVNRHVYDLAPGRTVAVARYDRHPLGHTQDMNCPVLLLDRWALRLPVRLARRAGMSERRLRDATIERFLRRHKVSVVLGEYLDNMLDFIPLLDYMKMPYVVQGHGIDVSARLRVPGMAEAYRALGSARAILTRCEYHRRRLRDIGLPAQKLHLNRGGVDVPAEPPRRGPEAACRFLALARMDSKKGPIYLLEAFRRAAVENPNIRLDYVGGGPLFPAARQFVDACGLMNRVRLHGVASEETKARLMRECGVFVQHSITNPETGDEEGLPAAIQEAMAQGMMVVSTRHSGIPEAVCHGETGLLVDEGDVDGMARILLAAPSRATDMGRAGHRRAASTDAWVYEKERLSQWLFGHRCGGK